MVRTVRVASTTIIALSLLISAALIYVYLIRTEAYKPDFTVFWTAGRLVFTDVGSIYDSEAITREQYWITNSLSQPRPFAYPPSSLLFFVPLSMLPLWLSLALFNVLSIGAFWLVVRRVVTRRALYLAIASPPVVFALISGQTALLVAAILICGVSSLPDRPTLAGSIMGIAAAVKPQNLILAPIAFVAGRHWLALATFFASGAATVGLSLIFGFALWEDWIASLVEFERILVELRLQFWGVTPLSVAHVFGLDGKAATLIQITGVLMGVSFVWWAFKRDNIAIRTVGLVCGGLLSTPYAMRYELVALAPFAASALLSGRPWGLVAGLPLTATGAMFTVPAMVVATVFGRREGLASLQSADPAAESPDQARS